MGDAKPKALLSAEKYLWNFLFKVAQGEGEFMPLVDELLQFLGSIDYGTLRENELQWFNMTCKFHYLHIRMSSAYYPRSSNSTTHSKFHLPEP